MLNNTNCFLMEKPDNLNFLEKGLIKKKRREAKLSLFDIALRLSLEKKQIIRYEKGVDPIPNNIYIKIVKMLNINS
mgnify:CR=1 FL=1